MADRADRRVIAVGRPYGTIAAVPTLRIAQDDDADELLGRDPLALLIGMLLDQHMRRGSSRVIGRTGARRGGRQDDREGSPPVRLHSADSFGSGDGRPTGQRVTEAGLPGV